MTTNLTEAVRKQYAATATSGLSSNDAGVRAVAEAFGYSADELSAIPAAANMGLSCGNPTATANLRAGETVVDLGSGGGLDVFLAAQKIGPTGKAIGIDMTPEMVQLAKANAAKAGIGNVEFHHATIDRLPLRDASADVVLSNCVINLAPDKAAVFREIARVLKPGGRVAISDIALKKPLPPELANDLAAYVGCIAGAIPIDEYRRGLEDAGLAHVQVIDSGADLNAYGKVEGQAACCSPTPVSGRALRPTAEPGPSTACCGGESPVRGADKPAAAKRNALPVATSGGCCGSEATVHEGLAALLRTYDVNDYAASVKVFALRPA